MRLLIELFVYEFCYLMIVFWIWASIEFVKDFSWHSKNFPYRTDSE